MVGHRVRCPCLLLLLETDDVADRGSQPLSSDDGWCMPLGHVFTRCVKWAVHLISRCESKSRGS